MAALAYIERGRVLIRSLECYITLHVFKCRGGAAGSASACVILGYVHKIDGDSYKFGMVARGTVSLAYMLQDELHIWRCKRYLSHDRHLNELEKISGVHRAAGFIT